MITLEAAGNTPATIALFEESATRVILTCPSAEVETVRAIAEDSGCKILPLGVTAARRLDVRLNGQMVVSETIADLGQIWSGALESMLHDEVHGQETQDELMRS